MANCGSLGCLGEERVVAVQAEYDRRARELGEVITEGTTFDPRKGRDKERAGAI
jgi:hypothetical protein